MDKLVRATAHNGDVRIIAAITTSMVQEGVNAHNCTPTASAALGRMLTAGGLMGAMLKAEGDSLTLQMDGGGEAKGIVVTAHADGTVKGYIGNPNVNLPLNEKGKLDVGGAIGKNGDLKVIRDMGLKDPYIGQVPIYTGEIGDDLAYYFTVSEQTPSAVALGVLVDTDLSIKAAGGFIIQMMPGASEFLADIITYRLQEIPSVTTMISKGMTIEEILKEIFEDMDINIYEEGKLEFKCDCSRERVESVLISIGKKELKKIYEEGKTEEVKCHFCNKSYEFTTEQLEKLLEEL
ncbi:MULTISPECIES: Hsp33 family molecular chaperone HslO [Clostridium]|uniref:33 kDa chaperonin n=1 Tax=Clostridium faecium TaxID=2762223 RepID=A0ABR8YRL6_9CLOT|nr:MULTISPECIES: Hsp33 family molecular chaperone HslO [Clostridium]MBD8046631.1 Hsp33 family molecular chaperone HslO [Clostridium faecium]MDU1347867.1 Hsp33 family molecular chaperone HslO [Clostridium argentinense]